MLIYPWHAQIVDSNNSKDPCHWKCACRVRAQHLSAFKVEINKKPSHAAAFKISCIMWIKPSSDFTCLRPRAPMSPRCPQARLVGKDLLVPATPGMHLDTFYFERKTPPGRPSSLTPKLIYRLAHS